ncbi:hypothetical protein KR100_01485 [Synechococcus sp. KORDI-100]|uniref:glycosyltransferase family 4 protein n=1 Tax=Synechococcus sp. KORDI-100 TaxID=1280380 RepID=UPI0004E03DA3|nr:glycosyltransferase [Synechococcus sp. KORDI-100]AII42079.1 hypothetical protein KR100_01485 [Synechococcus sp. KORDI-100]
MAVSQLPALIVSADFLPGGGVLNGRRWAGQQLLRAWARLAGSDPLTLLMGDPGQDSAAFQSFVREAGHCGCFKALPLSDPRPLAAVGALFLSDTSIGRWAQWRRPASSAAFSLIGQIHTISTPAAIEQIEDLVSQPLESWDAVFCSSTAGRNVVTRLMEDREDQILGRCVGNRQVLQSRRPQLPVVPLALPAAEIARSLPDRQMARQQLGLSSNEAVVLWLGRLSMLTKSDPWPAYRILQRAAECLQRSITLIECGPDDTEAQGEHFSELRSLCPQVRFVRLGGAQPVSEQVKRTAMSASDLALFLVDNLQETFGLAVAESMAAGLPVVASDWDGFRDLVRPGVDGFLVPTRFASTAIHASVPLAWQQRIGLTEFPAVAGAFAQLVQIDLAAACDAVLTLLSNPGLRLAMGRAAQRRAIRCFDAEVVGRQYLDYFAELAQRRAHAPQAAHIPQPSPMSLDPIRAFAGYPSSAPLSGFTAEPLQPLVQAGRGFLWGLIQQAMDQHHWPALQQDLSNKHGFPQI